MQISVVVDRRGKIRWKMIEKKRPGGGSKRKKHRSNATVWWVEEREEKSPQIAHGYNTSRQSILVLQRVMPI